MAAAGVLPVDRNKQEPDLFLLRATLFGWKIVQVMDEFAQATGLDLAVRVRCAWECACARLSSNPLTLWPILAAFLIQVGLHQGQVVAGVIGRARFAYDMWGDTVNIASRMEAASEPNKVVMAPINARKDAVPLAAGILWRPLPRWAPTGLKMVGSVSRSTWTMPLHGN
eukprot:scaffold723_cov363-Prasinococcus_capsulatus_cf.AAC.8